MLSKLRLLSNSPVTSHLSCLSRIHLPQTNIQHISTHPNDNNTCDVAIIGSGIMGLNVAYQIARRSPMNIRIFERYPSFGYSSSGHSSAILRHLYSKETMIQFANNGINQYKNWNNYLNSTQTKGKFIKTGWLLMSQMDKQTAIQNQNKLQKYGIKTNIIDKQIMNERFPQISTDCGSFNNELPIQKHTPKQMDNNTYFLMEEDAGCFEPMDALEDLTNVLTHNYAKNVQINYNSSVTDILQSNGKVNGIKINNSDEIYCKYVINCCGPFYNRIINKLDGLDIKFTLRPVRMQVIYKDACLLYKNDFLDKFKCYNGVPIPIIVDYFGGVYIRPLLQKKQISCGTCKEEEEQDEYDLSNNEMPQGCDPKMKMKFLNSIYYRLSPAKEIGCSNRIRSGKSGLYTKTDDVHYLIGNTKLDGFIVCNGFSGHGQKVAPAVGSIVAKYVTNINLDDDTDVDIDFFSPYREPYIMKTKNVLA
eukprot:168081_1